MPSYDGVTDSIRIRPTHPLGSPIASLSDPPPISILVSSSDRADLVGLMEIDDGLLMGHIPPQERLRHRVYLVVVYAIGEG